mgnify:CR=1 FL=1
MSALTNASAPTARVSRTFFRRRSRRAPCSRRRVLGDGRLPKGTQLLRGRDPEYKQVSGHIIERTSDGVRPLVLSRPS